MRISKLARFVVLYYSHVLTTIPVPIVLLALRVVDALQALGLVLFLAGFWTLVAAAFMISTETKGLRRLYACVGALLVLGSAALLALPAIAAGRL